MNDTENAEIMSYMTQPGQGAVRPTDPPRVHEVISDGQDETGAPMVAKVYADAGTTIIYDRKTGEPSITSINLLPAQLRHQFTPSRAI